MSRRYVDEWSEGVLAVWEHTSGNLRSAFVMPSGGDPVAQMMSPATEISIVRLRSTPSATDPLVGVNGISPTSVRWS